MEVKNGRKLDYNVHNLTFLRNNSYAQKINFDEEQNCFFMMDYYNLLKERKLKRETDGYMVLVGATKGEKNAVAKRIMGIYSSEDSQDEQIFQTAFAATDLTTTTSHPFLGIIQVYITDYMWRKNEENIRVQQIDAYLELYKRQIEDCFRQIFDKDDICLIYRTITSEDFCVIIRTSKFRKIYQAALQIMSIKNERQKRVFFTYTNIGIECVKNKEESKTCSDPHFLPLHESVREQNSDINFVLRFRIENEALEDIQALEFEHKNEDGNTQQFVIEAVNGMVGRYDLVVRLSMDEFMELYPHLCSNITGYRIQQDDSVSYKSKLVKILVLKMGVGIIQTINTRVIMDIYAKKKTENTRAVSLLDIDDINMIKKRSNKVMNLYKTFKTMHDNKFSVDKYRYVELTRMLDTLIYSYENLAYEIDTHINWFICSQYLEEFFQSMMTYMNSFHSNIEQGAVEKFLNEFQAFVSAFDIYLRLLQGINQNTIQSPRYDISAPIDGQKFLMAYSEFIDSVHEEYRNDEWDKKDNIVCREKRRMENTIIYPDLTIKNLELMEVFNYDRVKKLKEGNEEPAILICKIPMFEYFERPYDLIPLILHEICHHMLILKREIRNKFLIKRVFERVASEAVKQVQSRFVKKTYANRVDALTSAMVESLADALAKTFEESCPDYEQYVFLHLSKRIESFAYSYFEDEERKQNNQSTSYSADDIKEDFEKLISELYIDDDALADFQSIDLKADAPESDKYENLCKLVEFIKKLLVKINEITIKYENPIVMEELWGRNNQELDSYLLQWANCNKENILAIEISKSEEKKQMIKNYLELVKRTFILFTEAATIHEDLAGSFRKKLAKKLAVNAKRQYENFLKEDKYYIFDQDKMKKAAFWELKKENRAEERFIEAMECIDIGKIMGAIKFSITNYREICADTIMCRWLGLSSFGYFRKAAALAPRMQGYTEQIQFGAMHWERLVTVLAILVTEENQDSKTDEIDLSDLQRKIWRYIDVTIECAKERIWSAMNSDDDLDKEDAKDSLNDFFKRVQNSIQGLEKRVLENKKIVWEGSVWDRLYRNKEEFARMKEYFKYFYKEANIFKRLYDMLDAYNRIQINNKLHINNEVFEHMMNIYRNATEGKKLHKVVEEVARFYNDPESEKKTNMQKMEDMLCFVQDYYYCNRIKKAEESKWGLGMQKV